MCPQVVDTSVYTRTRTPSSVSAHVQAHTHMPRVREESSCCPDPGSSLVLSLQHAPRAPPSHPRIPLFLLPVQVLARSCSPVNNHLQNDSDHSHSITWVYSQPYPAKFLQSPHERIFHQLKRASHCPLSVTPPLKLPVGALAVSSEASAPSAGCLTFAAPLDSPGELEATPGDVRLSRALN